MARGDYFRVIYRTGAQTASEEKIGARSIGSSVFVSGTDARDPFLVITEENKAKVVIRTARFTKEHVVAVIEGHETIPSKVPTKVSR